MSLSIQVVAEPEQQTSDHHTLELATQRRVLMAYGQTIIYNHGGYAWLRPAMRDLLNINPAHREQVSTDGSETLQGLMIYISRMMDSATAMNGDGDTLFQAVPIAGPLIVAI